MTNWSNVSFGMELGARRSRRRRAVAPRLRRGRRDRRVGRDDVDRRVGSEHGGGAASAGRARSDRRPSCGSRRAPRRSSVPSTTARAVSGASQISKVESGTALRSSVRIDAQSRASCGVRPGVIDSFGVGCGKRRRRAPRGSPGGGEYTSGRTARRAASRARARAQPARRGKNLRTAAAARRAVGSAAAPRRPSRHETHLPAQEAQACPQPRVSQAHADEGRPPDAQAPPRQGPQAPHRLTAAARPTPADATI